MTTRSFFIGSSSGMRIAFFGFVIAVIGVIVGFLIMDTDSRAISLVAFAGTAIGVLVGFIGVVHHWVTEGKEAISGSRSASRELRERVAKFWTKGGSGENKRNSQDPQ